MTAMFDNGSEQNVQYL